MQTDEGRDRMIETRDAMPGPTYDVTPDSLAELLADEPAYRVRQVWEGLHRRALRPGEMTDLPRALRGRLEAGAGPGTDRRATRQSADEGETVEVAVSLADGSGSRPCSWRTRTG